MIPGATSYRYYFIDVKIEQVKLVWKLIGLVVYGDFDDT